MSLLEKLSSALSGKEEDLEDCLQLVVSQGSDIEVTDITLVKNLLNSKSDKVLQLAVRVIAEWAKNEKNRTLFTDVDIINSFYSLLNKDDYGLVIEVTRALANICYENEKACALVDEKAIKQLLDILKSDKYKQDDNTLPTKVSGCILNLVSTDERLAKFTLKNGLLDFVTSLLVKYKQPFNSNEVLLDFLLSTVNILVDYLDEHNVQFTEDLCKAIIDVFKISTNPKISVTCTEIFYGQSERDDVKTLLAKEGTCELLFELIEKYRHRVNDEDSRSVLKMACDLIVNVLTGDDCMYLLYDNGNGKVYKNMITWLESDDEDLLITGVLAIGNFARNEVHCIQMVKNKLSKKLLGLLKKYNKQNDIKVQYAILSTLKNLIIPPPNKAQVLEEGIIDIIYPIIENDQWIVVYKLLGTFRMIVDGQEAPALDLICRKEFLEKIVYWCYNSDHLGVRGEVPRLLARLIKNCHSTKPLSQLLSIKDCVKCLVEMVASNYGVMQNEAIYSIMLLWIGSITVDNTTKSKTNITTLSEQLIDADLGKNLQFILNKYGEKMEQSLIENIVKLLDYLVESKSICSHLTSSNLTEPLNNVSLNSSNSKERIQRLIEKLKS